MSDYDEFGEDAFSVLQAMCAGYVRFPVPGRPILAK